MLYSIAKKFVSRPEINNFKKTRAKTSKNTSDSSSDDQDSNSSLDSNSIREIYRRPAGRKEINRLYNLVIDNLNKYKDQTNEGIDSEPKVDTSSFNLSSGTREPFPVVTVFLLRGRQLLLGKFL